MKIGQMTKLDIQMTYSLKTEVSTIETPLSWVKFTRTTRTLTTKEITTLEKLMLHQIFLSQSSRMLSRKSPP